MESKKYNYIPPNPLQPVVSLDSSSVPSNVSIPNSIPISTLISNPIVTDCIDKNKQYDTNLSINNIKVIENNNDVVKIININTSNIPTKEIINIVSKDINKDTSILDINTYVIKNINTIKDNHSLTFTNTTTNNTTINRDIPNKEAVKNKEATPTTNSDRETTHIIKDITTTTINKDASTIPIREAYISMTSVKPCYSTSINQPYNVHNNNR